MSVVWASEMHNEHCAHDNIESCSSVNKAKTLHDGHFFSPLSSFDTCAAPQQSDRRRRSVAASGKGINSDEKKRNTEINSTKINIKKRGPTKAIKKNGSRRRRTTKAAPPSRNFENHGSLWLPFFNQRGPYKKKKGKIKRLITERLQINRTSGAEKTKTKKGCGPTVGMRSTKFYVSDKFSGGSFEDRGARPSLIALPSHKVTSDTWKINTPDARNSNR